MRRITSRELLTGETAYGRKRSRAKERDLKLMTNACRHTDLLQKNPTYRPSPDGLASFCVQRRERCGNRHLRAARHAQLQRLFSALTLYRVETTGTDLPIRSTLGCARGNSKSQGRTAPSRVLTFSVRAAGQDLSHPAKYRSNPS